MFHRKFSLKSSVGFSIPELMVVIVILGILASLAMPRLRAFIARSRQAEARNLLAQIHTLQQTHQNFHDQYASWDDGTNYAGVVGKSGNPCLKAAVTAGTCSISTHTTRATCTNAGGVWSPTNPGAFELGFKPQNCDDLRYGYWIKVDVDTTTGKEHYVAYAYAPSDTTDRIFPTCTGDKGNRSDTITHRLGTTNLSDITATVSQGDLQAIDEDKRFYHSDIIPNCE